MPRIPAEDVITKEVLEWKGLHLFYADFSLCSRKVQLCMGLKGLKFTPHVIDLATGGNRTDFYLGVNPRGKKISARCDTQREH